ncbi:UNC-like C-terminal-domain-containing protein [Schizothecium vesticola]|uniref:UNC-like C-terminal-domain-containing protein n=1 Tax=Schizothecium vesticola TaxID=314040 RepID=A0AA40BQK3_9PEZI|nr:UNC-like C-terminal-domain-containing protein [Schizothecium vesticola]
MKHPETFLGRGRGRGRGWAIALLLGLSSSAVHGSRSARDAAILSAASIPTDVCEFRTINYITHTLPQQCFRTAWTSPPTTATADPTATATGAQDQAPEATETHKTGDAEKGAPGQAQEADKEPEDKPNFASGSFMSFEEWKEMMLRKSGQDPAKIKDRKPHEHRVERDSAGVDAEADSIGEEGEILDFDALSRKVSELASSQSAESSVKSGEAAELKEEHVLQDDGMAQYYRGKDAGKTCKERFSFSSFDAGATVLKTSPGAKNPKAILVENKDTYMLLECNTKNKFVIVELSDDVLVDTVVLANFEFFSSMIRKFRVSVSDRYPVKLDKWVELGIFEARNARDIQPFLIQHPRIYTKYIRVEFLTHYGNEYYCPVSLLRVHGTRMLDTWKEQDHHDDEPEAIDPPPEPVAESNQIEATLEPPASITTEVETASHAPYIAEVGLSPWQPALYYNFAEDICFVRSPTTGEPTPVESDGKDKPPTAKDGNATTEASQATAAGEARQAPASHAAPGSQQSPPAPSQPAASPSPSASPQHDTRNSSAPTASESFFKTVTKRLSLLESNTSLSLQYIEEQSRFLRETLLKMESQQASRVSAFLDRLNNTVLAELRTVRVQYDQLWQSTVLALEAQRDQSRRESVALSARLAVLADEVVFQKRMAILQSVLLLSCLVLVIFSRGSSNNNGTGGGGNNSFSFRHYPAASASSSHYRHDSTSGQTPGHNTLAASPQIQHQHYRSSAAAEKTLPLTPTSQFSREGTPLIHVDVPSFYGDSSPSPPPQTRHSGGRRRLLMGEGRVDDGIEEEDEQDDVASPPPPREDSSILEEEEQGSPRPSVEEATAEQDSAKTLLSGRSSLVLQRGVRKPLPALPEDPS